MSIATSRRTEIVRFPKESLHGIPEDDEEDGSKKRKDFSRAAGIPEDDEEDGSHVMQALLA